MEHTQNYQLSQWSRTDQVKMEDFNADNAKLDGALSGFAQTLAAHTSELARKGNCQVSIYTYQGNGKFGEGNPTVIPFPKGTFLLFLMNKREDYQRFVPGMPHITFTGSGGPFYTYTTWTETSLSMYSERGSAYQYNMLVDYIVISFRKADDE